LADAEFDARAPLKLELQNASLTASGYLPDEGFLLRQPPTSNYAINAAQKRNHSAMDAVADAE